MQKTRNIKNLANLHRISKGQARAKVQGHGRLCFISGDVGTPQHLGERGCCSHPLTANGTLHSPFLPVEVLFSADEHTQSPRLEHLLKLVIPTSQQLSAPRPAVCSQSCSFCQGLSPRHEPVANSCLHCASGSQQLRQPL